MKTDELVALLSTNLEPVDRSSIVRTLLLALMAGSVLALGITIVGLGIRPDVMRSGALSFVATKVAFAIGISSLASVYLAKLSRPGGERKPRSYLIAMPFLVIVTLAAISLGLAPSSHWSTMVVGDEWLECLVSIPIIAIVPFIVAIWAVRQAAPTNLARTGAFAGLVAGGVSAMAYALHCTDDSLPFMAVWYSGTVVLCTLAGAAMGPRLLRW